jgi:hypothetical protein
MTSTSCFHTPAPPRPPRIATARFRVMADNGGQSRALVTLAATFGQAVARARRFCDSTTASPEGPRNGAIAVRVEEWVGTATEGRWRPVCPSQGGFQQRINGIRRGNGDHRGTARTNTGDTVEALLVAEKTRKGGWRAQLLGSEAHGPITNTADVPESALPGQTVSLRVGAISQDGRRIQFQWQSRSGFPA